MKRATEVMSLLLVALLSPGIYAMEHVGLYDGEQGRLVFKSQEQGQYLQAPTLSTDVTMNITGLVSRVTVTQRFTNPTDSWLNGVYTFPLPELSAVDHLNMRIGQRIIEGQIQQKEKARQTYQRAKREGKKVSLVEQQRPNIFTNNVANIGPGETVVVQIQYQQTLKYDQGEFSTRFPMVVAPRYIPNAQPIEGFNGQGWAQNNVEVPDASSITPQIKADDSENPHNVTIKVHLNGGVDLAGVTSDHHPIRVNPLSQSQYEIELEDNQVLANRDFVLRWRPLPSQQIQGAFFTQEKGDDKYALLMVVPPIEAIAKSQVLPKEMIFVIDTSGSMHGTSIEQARNALVWALERLSPQDKFNVIEFNSSAKSVFPAAVGATQDHVEYAIDKVRHMQAGGGTNINLALQQALRQQEDNSVVRQVVFITDGSVGNEESLFDQIKHTLGDSRLFTVGIGSAPNSRFMRGAATLGRGTFTYIGSLDQVRESMTNLFAKLQNPVLRDIQIASDDNGYFGTKLSYWPNPIRDLYLGEPVIVSLKLPKDVQNLSLTGRLADQDWFMDLPVDSGGTETGLDVLWARNKIHSLSESARNAAQRIRVEKDITELGLKYHLVTRYTSLVAVDVTPSKPEGERSVDKGFANHLPAGWTKHNPHGQLPQGATSAQLNLLIGALLLILTYLLQIRFKRN